ncbi:MAG: class I SAM-dependent methyltransferase [Gammaproteobacteria bacterium]|nr:class I SAM-dependent methyltransferase [Gammaproteobacteria bacterium]MCK5668085.1 class I SAM-dependent methyltransferase [Gammaproteobacteria bacterium]
MNSKSTDFGYQEVTPEEKTNRVMEVFRSVSGSYDVMNDLMSFGAHRLWKRHAVHLSGIKKGQSVLDVAGGTGDLSRLFHQRVGKEGSVLMTDINSAMLHEGRDKMIDAGIVSGIDYVQVNAEILPFANNSFDCISIAFGLRNVTDKQRAINSMFEKLRYGGCLIILEFSKIKLSSLSRLYDAYSFNVIPKIGKIVAKDEASYQYLVESIRMHPDQETLKGMIETAGFSKVEYFNLAGGIVAIHRAYKL